MKPASFTYHRARDVTGAVGLLAELGEDAKFIAGGQSLVAMMNFRLARPAHLVDLTGLSRELAYVRRAGDALRIGALATHHEVETAPAERLGPGFGVLSEAMRWLGHLPIRTRGTIGGSLAHGDATAEWCLLAVLLGAEIVVVGLDGRRVIPAEEFFHGFFSTALDPAELIVEVVFPRPAPHAALTEFAERSGDFATVAAAVTLDVQRATPCDGAPVGGGVRGGRVVLGGVAPAPLRIPEAEAVLAGGGTFAECAEAAASAIDPPSDANGSADYRRALTRTLVVRACEEAMAR
ncbi:xanthine dehydrogenase family protein subunit M [Actinomadura vinacea]|uniref:Xanthine dehydrogenase family protein subunit M n=1 Tax=Actinomadura vinacea TaxID=115336 RepID=A0ABN3IJC9_9ACTN